MRLNNWRSCRPSTPHVKYLITSREALNLQEEWLYSVSGLAFPTDLDNDWAGQNDDAVQLFNEQAQRVYPDFAPDKEVEAVIRICRLVEGMPLALELAAAWRKTLNCQAIADEIQGGLAFPDDAGPECAGTPSQYANGF